MPKKERATTKLLLFADQELEALGHELTATLLESCRKVLRSSGFWFKDDWARVISGAFCFQAIDVRDSLKLIM